MEAKEILQLRLQNLQLSSSTIFKVDELIAWLGGIQAQDYLAAKWAMGSRLTHVSDADIEESIIQKKLVRTWPMRSTLHFVSPEDIRWMMDLMGPKIISNNKSRYLQLQLDDNTLKESQNIIYNSLQGGKHLSRKQIAEALATHNIVTDTIRLSHILVRAGLQKLICFGIKQGSEQTYTLLDEWLPNYKTLDRKSALYKLTQQYFYSHGPASLQDYIWWSGLSVSDAKEGFNGIRTLLDETVFNGKEYYYSKNLKLKDDILPTCLLAAFDEYFIAYKDRSLSLDATYHKQIMQANGIFNPIILLQGNIVGTWKRTIKKNTIYIELFPFSKLSKNDIGEIQIAAEHYASFLGIKLQSIITN